MIVSRIISMVEFFGKCALMHLCKKAYQIVMILIMLVEFHVWALDISGSSLMFPVFQDLVVFLLEIFPRAQQCPGTNSFHYRAQRLWSGKLKCLAIDCSSFFMFVNLGFLNLVRQPLSCFLTYYIRHPECCSQLFLLIVY